MWWNPLLLLFFVFLCVDADTFSWGGYLNETHFRPAEYEPLLVYKVERACFQQESVMSKVTIRPPFVNGTDTANCLISDYKEKDCLGINDDPKAIATQAICASASFLLDDKLNGILVSTKGSPCMTIDKNGHFLSNITSSCDKNLSVSITSCFMAWKMFVLHDVVTIRNCSDNDTGLDSATESSTVETSSSMNPLTNYDNLDLKFDENNKAYFRPAVNSFEAREKYRDICESVDGLNEAKMIEIDPVEDNNMLCSFDDFNETDCVQDVTLGFKTRTHLICDTMEYIEYQRDFLEISNYELRSMATNVNTPCIDFENGKVTISKEICDNPMSIVHANCWIAWKKHVILDNVNTILCEDLPPRPTTTTTTTTSTTTSATTTPSASSSTDRTTPNIPAILLTSSTGKKSTLRPRTTSSTGNGSAIIEGSAGSVDSQKAKEDGGGGYMVWVYVAVAVLGFIVLVALLIVGIVFRRRLTKWLKKKKKGTKGTKGTGKSSSSSVISTLKSVPPAPTVPPAAKRKTVPPLKVAPPRSPVAPKKDPTLQDLDPKNFEVVGIITVEQGIKGDIEISETSSHSLLDAWVDDGHKVYFMGSEIEKIEEGPDKTVTVTCTEGGDATAARTARPLKSTKDGKGAAEKPKKIQIRTGRTLGKK